MGISLFSHLFLFLVFFILGSKGCEVIFSLIDVIEGHWLRGIPCHDSLLLRMKRVQISKHSYDVEKQSPPSYLFSEPLFKNVALMVV